MPKIDYFNKKICVLNYFCELLSFISKYIFLLKLIKFQILVMSNPFISLLFLIIFFGSFFGILHTKKLHKHVISGDISDQLESDQANRVPSAGLVPIEEDAEFGVANGEFDGVVSGKNIEFSNFSS